MLNKIGQSLESRGLLAEIDLRLETLSFILIENYLFERDKRIILKRYFSVFIFHSLYRPSCHTLSIIFDMSIKIVPVWQ